jgi:hypothetical protein
MLYSDPDGLTVKVCGTDGQCTDKDTHLSDEEFDKRFRHNKNIKLKDGKVFQNGEQIGTYTRLSCDECLYDIHAMARGVEAADPGRRATQLYLASVIAGATLPSATAGYIAIGVFTVLVPPGGGEDAVALSTQSDRQAAVREAWRQEAERARNGQPTKTPFTADELRQLRDTGKVSGYEGHHTESVSGNPQAARDASKIKFVNGRAAHLAEHGGNFRNRTPLKPR